MKMEESYPFGWKTLWEKEKMLVTSNFSFSHSVFKRLVSQGRQKVSVCGNGLKNTHKLLSVIAFNMKQSEISSFVVWYRVHKSFV